MPWSVTFIIMWGVRMGLVLFSLAFYPSQKVCFSIIAYYIYWLCVISWQGPYKWCWLPPVSAEAFSRLTFIYSAITSAWRGHSWSLSMSWWTSPAHHMGDRAIHRRLSWTSITSMYCEELVCSVSNTTSFTVAFCLVFPSIFLTGVKVIEKTSMASCPKSHALVNSRKDSLKTP